jgi:hypothetical protein
MYRILSPDGFDIRRDKTYATPEEAVADLQEWIKGFERQGYYSSVKGRIPLDELEGACRIEPFNEEEE